MGKIFATLRGIPLSKTEEEIYMRWKYLQTYSRDIVKSAIAMVTARDDQEQLDAKDELVCAVNNYFRLGGKIEDFKYNL